MATYLWKRYAEYLHTRWEKTFLWDSIEHYRRPQTFTPLAILYASAFYTGVIGAAITEQLYKTSVSNQEYTSSLAELMTEGEYPKRLSSTGINPRPCYLDAFRLRYQRNYPHFAKSDLNFLENFLFKEKYWEEHPGEAVPIMKPRFYYGPWKVRMEDHAAPKP